MPISGKPEIIVISVEARSPIAFGCSLPRKFTARQCFLTRGIGAEAAVSA